MKRSNNLAAKVAEDPEAISTMALADRREVARLLAEEGLALGKMLSDSERAFIAQLEAQGDRLISIEEVSDRLDCSVKAVRRGWKAGRYPFIIGDGGEKLVASEDGMGRWIKARANRQFPARYKVLKRVPRFLIARPGERTIPAKEAAAILEPLAIAAWECAQCGAVFPGRKLIVARREGRGRGLRFVCGAQRSNGELCASPRVRPLPN